MHRYTKRQVSVLLEEAALHRGGVTKLAREFGLSYRSLLRAGECRGTEASIPQSIVLRLQLKPARDLYATYECDRDLREVLGLPARSANDDATRTICA
jgi:hypothetical protein